MQHSMDNECFSVQYKFDISYGYILQKKLEKGRDKNLRIF